MSVDSKTFDFGLRLRELRENAKLSQKQLSGKIGISRSSLYRYESSQRIPEGQIVKRLAIVLNTTADYLLGITDAPTIKIHNLKPGQAEVIYDFIEQFIESED